MKLIKLTQGYFAKVDDEDYDYLNIFKWRTLKTKHSNYAVSTIDKKQIGMHRVVTKAKDCRLIIDHMDHDGLNNQKNNLRPCNKSQNNSNKRKSKSAQSKYLGVYYLVITSKKNKKYTYIAAQIQKDNKNRHIGIFKTEEDAARAYDKKAIELHGEFANLNFNQ